LERAAGYAGAKGNPIPRSEDFLDFRLRRALAMLQLSRLGAAKSTN
jgi:hypothetical protein